MYGLHYQLYTAAHNYGLEYVRGNTDITNKLKLSGVDRRNEEFFHYSYLIGQFEWID